MIIRLITTLILSAVLISSCDTKNKTIVGISLEEPSDPQTIVPVQKWTDLDNDVLISWGSDNQRYEKNYIPDLSVVDTLSLSAWQNERINAQAVIWSNEAIQDISLNISDLESRKGVIESDAVQYYFVRNVLADEFLGGCGHKQKSNETAHLIPDCLEDIPSINLEPKTTRGIWFTIDIPTNTPSGDYVAIIRIWGNNKKIQTLQLNLKVIERELPDPIDWKYHLDLWQHPFAVARVNQAELWSDAHFAKMKPLFKMLANAGQKCITATILHRPWGGQALDPYESMVQHTLKADGSWTFDYSIFDKWVSFMMELGIQEQINCYSMIPWGNQLSYFDEALKRDTFLTARASTPEFKNYWTPFLIDFSKHLKEKKWFEKTTIAMDERPMVDMVEAIEIIQKYSGLKITSAANYSPGLSNKIYDLSVESRHILPDEVLQQRKTLGQISTYYVCCSAELPNNFTYSPPSEGVWQGWYAFAKKQDGFLRWAYNSWVEEPLLDSRFRTWPAGDTYFVYPGAKSSIRWEKLREGIQDYEKLRILREEWQNSDSQDAKDKLTELYSILSQFEIDTLRAEGAIDAIQEGKRLVNH